MDLFNSSDFDARVEGLMSKFHIPGLTIAIVQGHKTASKAYGKASVETAQPCTTETLFDIASSSKSLTAGAVAILVADNDRYPEVQYDTPLCKLLPEDFVASEDEYTRSITVEDALSHRSGIPGHDFSCRGIAATVPDNARSVTRNLRNLPVSAPIRSKYMYSNVMFTISTHLVETKSGLSFSQFLEQEIFEPLEMRSTSLQPARAREKGLAERLAKGHAWDDETESYREFEPLDSPEAQGAGSIITSANDYIKWIAALMYQEDPITTDVHKGMTKPRSFKRPLPDDLGSSASPSFYATGLHVTYYRGRAIVAHNGGVPGFGSLIFFVPGLELGAAILGNSMELYLAGEALAQDLIDYALGGRDEKLQPSMIWPSQKHDDPKGQQDAPKVLYPHVKQAEAQKMPFSAYVGEYWNPGYHGVTVEVRDGKLYIDATDRSFPVEMTLGHVCSQTSFTASIRNGKATGGLKMFDVKAEFRFANDKAVKLGLQVEPELDDMIWFDRVSENESSYCMV